MPRTSTGLASVIWQHHVEIVDAAIDDRRRRLHQLLVRHPRYGPTIAG